MRQLFNIKEVLALSSRSVLVILKYLAYERLVCLFLPCFLLYCSLQIRSYSFFLYI